MNKTWKCDLCGYVHSGDKPPQVCPVCGADSSHFSPLEIKTSIATEPVAESWQCSICDHIVSDASPPDFCPICGASAELFHPFKATETTPVKSDIGKLVILGAGIAGLTAAEEARRQAPDVKITLVSREQSLPYYRLNLTRFLAGEVADEDLLIHQQEWFDSHQIDYLSGEAHTIDRDNQKVTLRDGQKLAYDRLILCNGAHPFIPPIPGANRDGVTVLRTIEHARALIKSIRPGCRAVVIGGGLLGLESAWAMQKQGASVTVMEGFDWLLPRQLPTKAANLLQDHLQKQSMKIMCGVQVKEFVGDEVVRSVHLQDGREVPADIVILATGVRPNSHLARECGLRVNQGVQVNDQLYTSDRAILAAGDVMEHQGRVYGIWPASYAQGMIAGANAVGGQAEFTGIPMTNRIKVLDVDIFSIGQIQASDASIQIYEVQEESTYRGLICRDNQIVGGVLYGDMNLIAEIQEAVENGQRLQEAKELTKHFPETSSLTG